MMAETLARAREGGFDRADGDRIVGGDLGYRTVVPITADEYYPRIRVKRAQKAVYSLAKRYVVRSFGHRTCIGEHFTNLVKNGDVSLGALFSGFIGETVEREISRYSAKIRRKRVRLLRRHSLPCAQISIVDAFLTVWV